MNDLDKFWNRDVNVTLHIEEVDYLLWTLQQNIEEIRDSSSYEENDEIDVTFIESIIDTLRLQAGYEEVA
jgi:hypothetical protein